MKIRVNGAKTNLGVIIAAYAILFSMGLVDNARGPIYPRMLTHFGFSAAAGSFMFTAASLGSVIVSWTGRVWLERFGAERAMRPLAGLLFAACVGMGALGFRELGLPGLIVVSLFFGIGGTGSSMCANNLIAQRSAPEHRRRLLSGLHAMYGASSLLSPMAVALFGRFGLDWRFSFFILAAAPLLAGALAGLAISGSTAPTLSEPTGSFCLPSRAQTATACLMVALYVAAEVAISTRLPLLVERVAGWSRESAALSLSAFFTLFLGGRLAFAVFRFPGRSTVWLAASASVSLVAFLAGLLLHPAALAACGITMSIFFPVAMDWMRENFGKHWEKVYASAIATTGAALVLMHLGIGILTDLVGIRNAMFAGPICLVAVLGLLASASSSK